MSRPSRTRCVLKWIGTAFSVLLLFEGVLSYCVAPALRASADVALQNPRPVPRAAPRSGVRPATYSLIFGAVAVPTALLWWRDRPFPSGHCRQCGYDLTGNVSGRCPECGTPLKREGEAT